MQESFKVAIVGSGPAGLSAAVHAARLGMSHIVLEKTAHLCDTIFRYQLGKLIMATPAKLPLRPDLDFREGKREQILEIWETQARQAGIEVRYGAEVKAIEGSQGNFVLSVRRQRL